MKSIIQCPICGGTPKDSGTFKNKVTIKTPNEWETERATRFFDADACMVPELHWLWSKWIRTIECCCGHGDKNNGYIAVDESDITFMENLGYKHCKQKPDRKDLFYPKYKKEEGWYK